VRERGTRPSYRVASSGPDHDKRFDADVYVNEELYGVGSGTSKKAAEQVAAKEALQRLEREGAPPPKVTEEARPDARAS
jgi:ribonuclease-3